MNMLAVMKQKALALDSTSSQETGAANAEGPASGEKCALIESLLAASATDFAFGLPRPGALEAWAAPLLERLALLDVWSPEPAVREWLDLCEKGSAAVAVAEATAAAEAEEENDDDGDAAAPEDRQAKRTQRAIEFHSSGPGSVRPDWVNAPSWD